MTSTKSFSSWTKSGSGTLSGTTYTFAAGNGTLTANYTNNSITLPNATRTGYQFAGWYTAASGGERKGGNGSSYTPTAATTLYAQWTANTYTIKFNSNGGSGSMSNLSMTYGTAKNLTTNAFTKTGYTFVGWSTSNTATSATYTNGQSVNNLTTTNGGTVNLYAIWKKTITITYNANGGSGAPSSQTATVYNSTTSYTFTLSTTKPTRSGYIFEGWADSSTSTTVDYQPGDKITLSSNKTLYAVWAVAKMSKNGVMNYYQTVQAAVNDAAVNTEMTIRLLVNRNEEFSIASNKKIDFNLNGKTLTTCIKNFGYLKIYGGTAVDGNYDGGGFLASEGGATTEITGGTYISNYNRVCTNQMGGTMIISGGTFNMENTSHAIYNYNNLTMTGGTINSKKDGIINGGYEDGTIATANISNVTFNTEETAILAGNVRGDMTSEKANVYVYNSNFNCGKYKAYYVSGQLVLYNCNGTGNYEGYVVEVNTDDSGFDIYIHGVDSSTTALFPAWTAYNEQDDLQWHTSTYAGNNTWKGRINRSEHKNEYGLYYVSIYKVVNNQSIGIYTITVNL